jgi:hypothetical protein
MNPFTTWDQADMGPKTMPNMIHKPPNLESTMRVERLAVVHDVQ